MANTPAPRSAGCLLAIAIVVGGLIGGLLGEPSLGVVLGIGTGAAIAVILWLLDRRRG